MRALMTENTIVQTMTPAAGALTGGTTGVAYPGETFALSAPVGNSYFSLALGSLPPGLTIVGDSLVGTPTLAGAYSFSIMGTDDFGNSVTNAYTLAVA